MSSDKVAHLVLLERRQNLVLSDIATHAKDRLNFQHPRLTNTTVQEQRHRRPSTSVFVRGCANFQSFESKAVAFLVLGLVDTGALSIKIGVVAQ